MKNLRTHSVLGITLALFFSLSTALNAQDKSQDGDWSDIIPLEVIPVAVSNLPDGKLIVWSAKFRETFNLNQDGMTFTEIYDPFIGKIGAGEGEILTNLNHDMFCPGINNLPDGRILSAGGT
ncbi:hypothetical protein, partial [Croceitalea sp. P059]|uniref:hypothetical protein n=1 Tax=Croceitalea sp. P059 TaxID=3075601 RepID=UPI00288536D3